MSTTKGQNDSGKQEKEETGRTEAFSDGIFAIAITLLVLDIKVPKMDPNASGLLLEALTRQWPNYTAFLISFLTVLIMWVNHHALFKHIKRVDHPFLLLNGILLLFVTITPFPTGLLAEYVRATNSVDGRVAAAVYTGCSLGMAFAYNCLWRYASYEGRLLGENYDADFVTRISNQYRFGPLMYAIAFTVAFFSMAGAILLCALLALFFTLPGLRRRH